MSPFLHPSGGAAQLLALRAAGQLKCSGACIAWDV
jgi:hypothetical protein